MSEYPLKWPPHWPRCKSPGKSQFKTSLAGALKNVEDELRRFSKDSGADVRSIVISSNVSLTRQNPPDPGVAVYFQWDDIATCIAVDRYEKVQDNLQAIAHCIEAERTKMRHGGLHLVRATFQGYAALPAPSSGRKWYDVLEVKQDASLQTIEANYKRLIKDHHPDRGGDVKRSSEINAAYTEAKKARA